MLPISLAHPQVDLFTKNPPVGIHQVYAVRCNFPAEIKLPLSHFMCSGKQQFKIWVNELMGEQLLSKKHTLKSDRKTKSQKQY